MMSNRTVEEKTTDWLAAFRAVQAELTPEALRVLTTLSDPANIESINLGLAAARIVFANDRAAAMVAALITQAGIKPVSLEVD